MFFPLLKIIFIILWLLIESYDVFKAEDEIPSSRSLNVPKDDYQIPGLYANVTGSSSQEGTFKKEIKALNPFINSGLSQPSSLTDDDYENTQYLNEAAENQDDGTPY